MKPLLLFGLVFFSSTSFAENFDCSLIVRYPDGHVTAPKTGSIEITDNQATLINWGTPGNNVGPLDVIREAGRIRIDYRHYGSAFTNGTPLYMGIILTQQDGGNYKYDLDSIDDTRTDTCILK